MSKITVGMLSARSEFSLPLRHPADATGSLLQEKNNQIITKKKIPPDYANTPL